MKNSFIRLARFGAQVKELRIHVAQTDVTSKGVREFIDTGYTKLKLDNPNLPILIRECEGVQPRLWARFELGKEKSWPLTNLTSPEVLKQIEAIADK